MFEFLRELFRKLGSIIMIILASLLGLTFVLTLIYPLGYRQEIVEYSSLYNLDPILVATVINVESNYNKNAKSHQDARGLMQVGPQTGEWGAAELGISDYTAESLYNPDINIRIGCWYLDKLNKEFHSREEIVLAAYNAGSGNVKKWLANPEYSEDASNLTNIPFKETSDYLQKIDKRYEIYSNVYSDIIYQDNRFMDLYFELIVKSRKLIKNVKGAIKTVNLGE